VTATTLTEAEGRAPERSAPPPPAPGRPAPDLAPIAEAARSWWPRWAGALAFAFLGFAVLAFSQLWSRGGLVLDGPGASLWVRLALDHWLAGGVPYWLPEMWAGAPAWALAPTVPVLSLLPLAAMVGADRAVQLATLGAQVAGAWGTYVLARSLWEQRAPAVVAGFLYGLHPLLVAHAALAGHQPALGVMAATPWLVWSVRKALRGESGRYVAVSGLIAGLAVLQQPEHAYGLVLLIACLVAVELRRAWAGRRAGLRLTIPVRSVLLRAGVICALGFGMIAYWLFPFASLAESFVLTPPNAVRSTLIEGVGGYIGRRPGLFLTRSEGLSGVVAFENTDFFAVGGFYLSWVCLGLTLLALPLLGRRDRDGNLTAILFASAIAIWMQTGGIPLASSGLVEDVNVVALAVIGTVAGLLVGSFLRRLTSGRLALLAGTATAAFLVSLPYLAPFLALQQVVPLLASVRFPRLYPIAVLGLALGAAFPLTRAALWARRRAPSLAPPLTAALCLAVLGAFLVDAQPYRSFYEVVSPPSAEAYDRAASRLAASGGDFRVLTFLEPRMVAPFVERGWDLSTGWPHPVASRDVWRLTAEAIFAAPREFRDVAFGLSGSAYLAYERTGVSAGLPAVEDVFLERNPRVQPLVRAYGRTLVVNDHAVAPELAVALSPRNIGVVTGGRTTASRLAPTTDAFLDAGDTCTDEALAALGGPLAGEVATACSVHRWVGVFTGLGLSTVAAGAGGVFRSPIDGLRGIRVWLDKPAHDTELVLRELGPDGLELGPEVARARAQRKDHVTEDLSTFTFAEPVAGSAGKRYLFLLSCPRCTAGEEPRMIHMDAERGPATLVTRGTIRADLVGAFILNYEGLEAAEPSSTTIRATRPGPGRWDIETSGDRPALVVVAESWFPGWEATVDGRPVEVVEADGAFLGVPVGAGDHRIALQYREPRAAVVGRVATVVSLGLAVALLVVPGLLGSRAGQPRARQPRGRRRRGRGGLAAKGGATVGRGDHPRRSGAAGGAEARTAPGASQGS
jgi:hypothetical protein